MDYEEKHAGATDEDGGNATIAIPPRTTRQPRETRGATKTAPRPRAEARRSRGLAKGERAGEGATRPRGGTHPVYLCRKKKARQIKY